MERMPLSVDSSVSLPARVAWHTAISWQKADETRGRPPLKPAGSNSWLVHLVRWTRFTPSQLRCPLFQTLRGEDTTTLREICRNGVGDIPSGTSGYQFSHAETERGRLLHFLGRWRGSALGICRPLHSCISLASRDKLPFSCSDPLFSFSYGEQWVQCPDPQGEMRLRPLPWKPRPCFSNQQETYWTHLLSGLKTTELTSSYLRLKAPVSVLSSSLYILHNMLRCLRGFSNAHLQQPMRTGSAASGYCARLNNMQRLIRDLVPASTVNWRGVRCIVDRPFSDTNCHVWI